MNDYTVHLNTHKPPDQRQLLYRPCLCHNREQFSLVKISQSVMLRVVNPKPSK